MYIQRARREYLNKFSKTLLLNINYYFNIAFDTRCALKITEVFGYGIKCTLHILSLNAFFSK